MERNRREVTEGLQYQSSTEKVAYTITMTNWKANPASATATAYDENAESDVTSTVYPTNNPSVSGDVVALSLLQVLIKGHTYRIEVAVTYADNSILEPYFRVNCDK